MFHRQAQEDAAREPVGRRGDPRPPELQRHRAGGGGQGARQVPLQAYFAHGQGRPRTRALRQRSPRCGSREGREVHVAAGQPAADGEAERQQRLCGGCGGRQAEPRGGAHERAPRPPGARRESFSTPGGEAHARARRPPPTAQRNGSWDIGGWQRGSGRERPIATHAHCAGRGGCGRGGICRGGEGGQGSGQGGQGSGGGGEGAGGAGCPRGGGARAGHCRGGGGGGGGWRCPAPAPCGGRGGEWWLEGVQRLTGGRGGGEGEGLAPRQAEEAGAEHEQGLPTGRFRGGR
mmetsp:Transcript_15789/g.61702  ORF Transcript_15789/g.61702 Transcript_15789/m.61702 type:complete len:290 (-) Transcript_15789:248-1117(-)